MEFLNGFAALIAFGGLIVLWLIAAAVQQFIVEGAVASVRFLCRAPLHLLDQAAAFWLFMFSPAYRHQQVAVLEAGRGRERSAILRRAAFSALCGLALPALLVISIL